MVCGYFYFSWIDPWKMKLFMTNLKHLFFHFKFYFCASSVSEISCIWWQCFWFSLHQPLHWLFIQKSHCAEHTILHNVASTSSKLIHSCSFCPSLILESSQRWLVPHTSMPLCVPFPLLESLPYLFCESKLLLALQSQTQALPPL